MVFLIEKFTRIELLFDLEEFYAAIIASVVVNEKWQGCFGVGYEHDRIYASWKMQVQFYNCTKNLLNNVFDVSEQWTGYDATILENCDYNDGNMISLWEASLQENTIEPTEWVGTFDADSALCVGGFASSDSSVNSNVRKWLRSGAKAMGEYAFGDASPFKNLPIEDK